MADICECLCATELLRVGAGQEWGLIKDSEKQTGRRQRGFEHLQKTTLKRGGKEEAEGTADDAFG
jgi:hypothetical protein